jgi:hypothetical protein
LSSKEFACVTKPTSGKLAPLGAPRSQVCLLAKCWWNMGIGT